MDIDLTKVRKRSKQEIDEKGRVKSKRGGGAKKGMVGIHRTIHISLKKRMEECVFSEKTHYNSETEFLRAALDKLLKKEGF